MNTRVAMSSMTPALAASLLALGVAGCTTLGPAYQRPSVAPAAQFRSQVGASEATSLADLPWWQVFNDKALQSLITEGLSNNYDLKAAIARIDEASAQVAVVRADLYPQVNYQASATRQASVVVPTTPPLNLTYNLFGLGLNAAWELDLWGRVRHATEAASANLYAQEDVRRGVMLSLVSAIASGYFSLLELDRELAIAQESSGVYKQTLDLFQQRFDAGRDSKLAVVRAQANYQSSQASIAALTRAITQQENALCVLLGVYPRPIARGTALSDESMPATPLGQTTALLERRPDVLQAEQVMIGANAEIGVAVANYFPRIGLGALFGWAATRPEDLFKNTATVWGLGANLAGPIFQGGRLQAQYHAQQAFWDESIAGYKKVVTVAFQETSDALVAQQTLVGQRAALERQVDSLKEAVDLAMQRYDAGRATYFEVLESEQLLFPSKDALAQTQRDQLLTVVSLYKALGGGWNLKDADWTVPH